MYVALFSIFNFMFYIQKFCTEHTCVLSNLETVRKIVIIHSIYYYHGFGFYTKIRKSFKHLAEIIYNHIFPSEYDKRIVLTSVKNCVKCFLKESEPLCYVKAANHVIRTPFTRRDRGL